ncbi:uncharacterized protein M6B38_404865 [Iris pallida]|uniref:CREG-like beta-barrel domain-containing protein n=1 Tax=Iris pallida TaxID=29817 RepID=A0AAX6FRE7_IRIPA|nr:uncharacterized protein M6B38_404865 [Iris pallida]
MEALSSSTIPSGLDRAFLSRPSSTSPLIKVSAFPSVFSKTHEKFQAPRISSAGRSQARFRAVTHGDGELGNGSGFIPEEGSAPIEGGTSDKSSFEEIVTEKLTPTNEGSGKSGSRPGLFRTPISGGVQSATSVHDLPRPALAVRNLMEQARFAHLCTVMSRMHHRRAGYPFGSLVDFAPDPIGHPIFSFSPLAIHTRNVLADPRCTLVVQIPGWSGLSNARVTIFGDIVPLPDDQQECARQQYISKHQQWASQKWGNFYYYRMQSISDIYFIGGFGTVQWVDVKEYETLQPDKIAADGGEQNLKELNAIFSKPLRKILSTEAEIDDAALISIDSKGIDIRVRQGAQSACRMQETPAGAELPSNALRRGAISGALERCKKLKHPIQDIMYRNIAMNHSML